MQDESKQDEQGGGGYADGCVNPYTEALVVQQVFREARGYPRARLERDLDDLDPVWVAESIASLEQAGVVVVVKRTRIHRSRVLRRLAELDLIGC
jgi:hypothetical protein